MDDLSIMTSIDTEQTVHVTAYKKATVVVMVINNKKS